MILVFAGTKDGRDWVQERLEEGESLVVSVATDYGASLYPERENLQVICGRKNAEDMKQLMKELAPDRVADATHPYAVEVSKNVKAACQELGLPYERILRKTVLEGLEHPDIRTFASYERLVAYLEERSGKILWTIGSKALSRVITDSLLPRSYVRVLPTSAVIQHCESLGLNAGRILGLQGPFSVEMNQAMYQEYDIAYMVTKDSGTTGGTMEKVLPALEMGIQVLVYGRPTEEGSHP